MTDAPVLMWFRRDLRLADNDALCAAAASGAPVIPVYVLDLDRPRPPGGAGLWWLDKSLAALGDALAAAGSPLVLRRGQTAETLLALAKETGAARIVAGRLYEEPERELEATVGQACAQAGVAFETFRGGLLTEPGEVVTGSGGPYKVFTPYWRALHGKVREVAVAPRVARLKAPAEPPGSDRLADWGLHPSKPDWSAGFDWTPGEAAAHKALTAFVSGALKDYPAARVLPAIDGSSRLSPHLHWGELSSRQVWKAVCAAGEAHGIEDAREKYLSEVGWRDFDHQLLTALPDLPTRSISPQLARLKWRHDEAGFTAWTKGLTGYPIVDAGMRQLWTTGWMHNRVRMITASFLIKDLLIDWTRGYDWFWDCLVDADEANNAQNWQWVAGTSPDSSPFYRVFTPVGQSQKFDKDGDYIRRFVPELARLPAPQIHAPWEASAGVLQKAGVMLGETYPRPIVDHAQARDRALAAYQATKAA